MAQLLNPQSVSLILVGPHNLKALTTVLPPDHDANLAQLFLKTAFLRRLSLVIESIPPSPQLYSHCASDNNVPQQSFEDQEGGLLQQAPKRF